MVYWDTSALLKLYVGEPDSGFFLRLAENADEQIATSAIAAVEVLCSLIRKESSGALGRGGAHAIFSQFLTDSDAGRIVLVPYGPEVLVHAGRLARLAAGGPQPVLLRSLDAIHIATAMAAGAKTMVATDQRLRQVAGAVKLRLLP